MTAIRRVLSGSIASWFSVAISFFAQICLVPVYLSYWDTTTYGVWLGLQSVFSFIQVIDNGHNRYLWNEFLRLTSRRRALIRRTFWSAAFAGVLLGGCQAAVVFSLMMSGAIPWLFGHTTTVSDSLVLQFSRVLMAYSMVWWIFGSVGGILTYVFLPFGYFSKTAWWGAAVTLITAVVPAIAVILGADLQTTGLMYVGSIAICYVAMYTIVFRWMRTERIFFVRPSYKIMMRNLSRSQMITVQTILDLFRQQGVRLVLSPFVGASGVTEFATTRTIANVALQGLQTVSNPIQPDLMRYLGGREQSKMETSFSLVWIIVLFGLMPSALLLQYFVGGFFELWTQHSVHFSPFLFATLLATVLLFGATQPAMSVVIGNNLIGNQLTLSALSASVTLCLMMALVPNFGLNGAGISLLVAECFASIGYVYIASKQLLSKQLSWPKEVFVWVLINAVVCILGVCMIAIFQEIQHWLLLFFISASIVLDVRFWLALPRGTKQFATHFVYLAIRRMRLVAIDSNQPISPRE